MLTDGRTDGQKIGRLYRTLLQAGAIKTVTWILSFIFTMAKSENIWFLKKLRLE